jgi:hypothetical protein
VGGASEREKNNFFHYKKINEVKRNPKKNKVGRLSLPHSKPYHTVTVMKPKRNSPKVDIENKGTESFPGLKPCFWPTNF